MSLKWKKKKKKTFELISSQNAPCFSRSGASLSLINNALMSVSYWETQWCSTPLGAHYLNNHFKCIRWCTWQHTAVEIQHCSSMDGGGGPRCLKEEPPTVWTSQVAFLKADLWKSTGLQHLLLPSHTVLTPLPWRQVKIIHHCNFTSTLYKEP